MQKISGKSGWICADVKARVSRHCQVHPVTLVHLKGERKGVGPDQVVIGEAVKQIAPDIVFIDANNDSRRIAADSEVRSECEAVEACNRSKELAVTDCIVSVQVFCLVPNSGVVWPQVRVHFSVAWSVCNKFNLTAAVVVVVVSYQLDILAIG